MPVALPRVSVVALFSFGPGASGLTTVASNSLILRSKAVSCVSMTDAVLSPLGAERLTD